MNRRILALLLLLPLLAACGPFDQATPTPGATATVAIATVTTAPPPATDTAPPAATATEVATATAAPTDTTAPVPPTDTTVAATPTTAAAQPTATTVAQAEPSATAAPVDPVVEAQIQQIESQTVAERGLKPKAKVPDHFLSSDAMAANLKKEITDEYKPDEAKRDTLTYWLLRLIDDPQLDLIKLQEDLLGEQVVGYYDPKAKELFVRQEQAALDPEQMVTLAHEYTHALQDQYYDLQKIRPDTIDADAGTAVTALIEGDASLSEIIYAQTYLSQDEFQKLLDQSQNAPSDVLDKAPAYIRESLLFPYVQGSTFVTDLYKAGGFKTVNAALADPPTSSEQILHPEKYTGGNRDNPLPITLPPLTSTLGAGWTSTYSDTLGEFDLQIMLRENGVSDYEQAAAGWGGAKFALYENGDTALVQLGTQWDSKKDADEFEAALNESLKSATKNGQLLSDGSRFFAIVRQGTAITLIVGNDQAAVQKALAATATIA